MSPWKLIMLFGKWICSDKRSKTKHLCWNSIIFNASKDLEIKYLQNIMKTFWKTPPPPCFLLSKRTFTQLQEIWLVILVTFILYCEKEKSFVPVNSHNCLRNMFGLLVPFVIKQKKCSVKMKSNSYDGCIYKE